MGALPTMLVHWPKFGPTPVHINVSAFDPAVHTRWEEYQAPQESGPASVGEVPAGDHAIAPDAPASSEAPKGGKRKGKR